MHVINDSSKLKGCGGSTTELFYKLIERAAENFSEAGPHGTSIAKMAMDVGVAKASLYYYVDSKNQLIEKSIESLILFFQKTVVERLGPLSLNSTDIIKISHILTDFVTHRPYGQLYFGLAADYSDSALPEHALLLKYRQGWQTLLTTLLNDEKYANILLVQLMGLGMMYRAEKNKAQYKSFINDVIYQQLSQFSSWKK